MQLSRGRVRAKADEREIGSGSHSDKAVLSCVRESDLCAIACRPLLSEIPDNACARFSSGSAVPEPIDLRSHNGVLEVDLTIHNDTQADGSTRYCYIDGNGHQSPNLRLRPGDLLILHLKNDLKDSDPAGTVATIFTLTWVLKRIQIHARAVP
jgi:hypothetical protein